jgi:hypothetical protein
MQPMSFIFVLLALGTVVAHWRGKGSWVSDDSLLA